MPPGSGRVSGASGTTAEAPEDPVGPAVGTRAAHVHAGRRDPRVPAVVADDRDWVADVDPHAAREVEAPPRDPDVDRPVVAPAATRDTLAHDGVSLSRRRANREGRYTR